jgi:hypothetical protein
MTAVSTNGLKRALDQVDRERRRANFMMCAVFAMTIVFWVSMMFSANDHKGLPFGLAAIIGSVYAAGLGAMKASHDNTRTILRAIESLASEKDNSRS